MAIVDLPHQEMIDRTSGPKKSGFDVLSINFSSKVSQRAFDGPTQESSRNEVWTVRWKLLQYLTPQEVIDTGTPSQYDTVKSFYESAYLGKVRWKPFEIVGTRIWEIVPNSFTQNNPAGCIFDVKFDIRYLYTE